MYVANAAQTFVYQYTVSVFVTSGKRNYLLSSLHGLAAQTLFMHRSSYTVPGDKNQVNFSKSNLKQPYCATLLHKMFKDCGTIRGHRGRTGISLQTSRANLAKFATTNGRLHGRL